MNIELPLDGKQRALVRPASKALFKSEYALEVYLLIALEPRFYKGQLARLTGCQPSFASSFIKRLQEERLVEPLSTEEGQQRHYMRKVPGPIWDALVNLALVLLSDSRAAGGAEVTQLPQRP